MISNTSFTVLFLELLSPYLWWSWSIVHVSRICPSLHPTFSPSS